MLTQDETNYLSKIDPTKKVFIHPFSPKVKETGDNIISKIKREFPNLEVVFLGTTALGISGQNDIDINVLVKPVDFDKYLPTFEKLFGKPLHIHNNFIEWNFNENGNEIELYLTNPEQDSLQRQLKVFNILKSDQILLKEYENMKSKFNGKSFHDYQKAKYEFYNKILGE
jgi:hypothetical protein